MVLNKLTIGLLAGAGIVVCGVAGGYGASLSIFDSVLEQGKHHVQNTLLSVNPMFKDLSIDFYENNDSSLFTRSLTMVVVNHDTKVTIPIIANIGFLNYDIDLLLSKAKIDNQYLSQREELKDFVNLESNVKTSAFSDKFTFALRGVLLNHAKSDPKATTHFSLISDIYKDHSSTLSFKADNIWIDQILFKDVSMLVDSEASKYGYPGVLKFNAAEIVDYNTIQVASNFNNFTTIFDYSTIRPNGDLDIKYTIKADRVGEKTKDLNLEGMFKGLNLKDIKEEQQGQSGDVLSNSLAYLSSHSYSLTLDPNSGFKIETQSKKDKYAKPQDDLFTFGLTGYLNYDINGKNKLETKVVLKTDKDINTMVDSDYAELGMFFVKNNAQYQSEVDFNVSDAGDVEFLVNKKPIDQY